MTDSSKRNRQSPAARPAPLSALAAVLPAAGLSRTWRALSVPPRLQPGAAQVWACSTEVDVERLAALQRMLADEEIERAEHYRHAGARRRFIVARALLRCALAAALERPPQDFRFAAGEHGKPEWVAESGRGAARAEAPVAFNLAHADSLALVALTPGTPLGVDVERVSDGLDWAGIAQRYFAPAEFAELSALPPAAQSAAFYRCWTLKEAVVKTLGAGLAYDLKKFRVAFRADSPARLLRFDDAAEDARQWSLLELELPAGYVGALAARAPGLKLEYCTPAID